MQKPEVKNQLRLFKLKLYEHNILISRVNGQFASLVNLIMPYKIHY